MPSLLRAIETSAYVVAPSVALTFLRMHQDYIPTGEEEAYLHGCADVCERRYHAAASASDDAHRAIMVAIRAPGGRGRPVAVALLTASDAADRAKASAWDTLAAAGAAVALCHARRNSVTRTLRFK